jgi:ParB-like chromosome segregation protein Spo0J
MHEIKIQSENIELVETSELVRHPKNMHQHSEDQIERLSKLIDYQGWRVPLIVEKGTNYIVAGNGRHMVAEKKGIKKVPVIYQEFESEAQLYAFIVSDNAIGKDTWATLDLSQINLDIQDLGPELDIDMLGLKSFKVDPIDNLDLNQEPRVDEIKTTMVTCPECSHRFDSKL